ncbi:hypothetical protein GDO81_021322 [Engystomops pustulosus]|uniref:Uncharacterized protein n=1 Tax=Engystomops pustulosus TaxID=76066 RepID=A0AAV6ZJP7_ENGPU|nr:hypothetical protein GDO81_021322 [Engystomops pustulosus]
MELSSRFQSIEDIISTADVVEKLPGSFIMIACYESSLYIMRRCTHKSVVHVNAETMMCLYRRKVSLSLHILRQ